MIVVASLLLLLIYVVVACVRYKGMPPSISDTFYPPADMGHWFTVVLFIAGIGCAMGLLNMSEGSDFQFVSFLTGAGMLLVGAAPYFRGYDKTVHYTGACILLISSQVWIALHGPLISYVAWIPWALICIIKPKCKMFLLEMACISSIILCMVCI